MDEIKKVVRKFIVLISDALVSFLYASKSGRVAINSMASRIRREKICVNHNNIEMEFLVPNLVSRYRAETFSSKEPETLEWIEQMRPGSVLWDIGANVGLYSIYAAKNGCQVYSFEPSIFNLEWLASNVYNNDVVDKITIIPVPLTSVVQSSTLNMSSTEWAGALSSFGEEYGQDGVLLEKKFEYSTVGMSMTDVVRSLNIESPTFIKIDVDGIEGLILSGGSEVLQQVDGVLVEVDDSFQEQSDIVKGCLANAGLVLNEKRHSALYEGRSVYNQIWNRG